MKLTLSMSAWPDNSRARALWWLLLAAAAAGCAEQELTVHRVMVDIPAPAPAANSKSGKATPQIYNRARFLRYRAEADPGKVRAIVICVPGAPAGAMAFDELARRLVRLSEGAVEVWAIDRRANLLEDLTGMQHAERQRDPDLAWRYYDDNLQVDGKRYAGRPTGLDYMSEWGLATAVADLKAVVDLVPATSRARAVVLLGHSFGASMVQAYTIWDRAGATTASEELAGLVLMDGGFTKYKTPMSEAYYLKKGSGTTPGLEDIRAGKGVYLGYYGFGLEAFMAVEVTGMRAWLDPGKLVQDSHVKRYLSLLFLKEPPPMTAAAVMGFTVDDGSSLLPAMRASCGKPDGPVETFTSALSQEPRVRPSSTTHKYRWLNHDQVTPKEKTPISVLARVAHEGPTNRLEWYFPSRLLIDTFAVSNQPIAAGSWQDLLGIKATQAASMEAPVLAVNAGKGTVPDGVARHRHFWEAISAKVGAGRPRAGARRADHDLKTGGFSFLDLPSYAHDDLVHAATAEADRDLYRPLLDWVLSNTSGEHTVPRVAETGR